MGVVRSKPKNSDAIIVMPNGGLGNQLFQIANGYAYSLRYGKRFLICKSWKGMSKARPCYWRSILQNLQSYLINPRQCQKTKRFTENSFSYEAIPTFDTNIVFEGYYQSEKYFIDYETEIQKLFSFPKDLFSSLPILKQERLCVAVHIRRGDYIIQSDYHSIIPKEYYVKAKALLEEKLGCVPIYYFFSDNIEYVKEMDIINEDDKIITKYQDYEELYLMSQCDHFIMANSSFSWWAAWLSQSQPKEKKIVIAPDNWFGPKGPQDYYDVYCQNWIQLSFDSQNNLQKKDFFLGILNCKKYENKRRPDKISTYNIDFRYFIGDESLIEKGEAVEEIDKFLVRLPCKDNYESLPQKVFEIMKWFRSKYPEKKYMIKADDDVLFDFKKFENYLYKFQKENLDYAGHKVVIKKKTQGKCHLGRTEDKKLAETKIDIFPCEYVGGPVYLLSRKSVDILIDNLFKEGNKTCIYEDVSVGYCLNEKNIYPVHFNYHNRACYWK